MSAANELCHHCGKTLKLNSRFCTECGKEIPQPVPATGPTMAVAPHAAIGATLAIDQAPPPVALTSLKVGDTLHNKRYTVERLLGRGGMGAVYRATDRDRFNEFVVIKEILNVNADSKKLEQSRKNFEHEAKTLAKLRYPHIAQIYQYFEESGSNYMIMEYIEGRNLQDLLAMQGKAYSEKIVIGWGIVLCEILEYLAKERPPIVHHDIKPANIILDTNNKLKLVDFGIAKARADQNELQRKQTQVFATAGYAPPEQYQGLSEPRSDVYALAATLYYLATNDDPVNHPFTFPNLSLLSEPFAHALSQALESDVQKRYTARQFHDALHDIFQQGKSTTNPIITTPTGHKINNPKELAQWSINNWHAAAAWLRGHLPDVIETGLLNAQLAKQLREINASFPQDPDAALDIAIDYIDPTLKRANSIQITPNPIEFNNLSLNVESVHKPIEITNTGERYQTLSLSSERWLRVMPPLIKLMPNATCAVDLSADARDQRIGGVLLGTLGIKSHNGLQRTIPVKGDLPYVKSFIYALFDYKYWFSTLVFLLFGALAGFLAFYTVMPLNLVGEYAEFYTGNKNLAQVMGMSAGFWAIAYWLLKPRIRSIRSKIQFYGGFFVVAMFVAIASMMITAIRVDETVVLLSNVVAGSIVGLGALGIILFWFYKGWNRLIVFFTVFCAIVMYLFSINLVYAASSLTVLAGLWVLETLVYGAIKRRFISLVLALGILGGAGAFWQTYAKDLRSIPEIVPEPTTLPETETVPTPVERPTDIPVPTLQQARITGTSALNIRAEPSAESADIGDIAENQLFELTGNEANGWLEVQVGDIRGWVNGTFVERVP